MTSPAPTCLRAARPSLTALEPRRMMYSFALDNGTLRLNCDATSQDLGVALVNGKIRATLVEGGTQLTQQEWTDASVSQILIFCDAGNDRVDISKSIKDPCIVGGGEGNDTLIGGGGNDSLAGSPGNDFIDGRGGSDTMIGGGGIDTVDYSSRTANLRIVQNQVADDGEAGENDRVSDDVARIQCGSGNDYVFASSSTSIGNFLLGNAGSDTLFGNDGNDTIYGGDGNDSLDGGGGRDLMYGDPGKDTMIGGSGNDTLKGGKGNDRLFGGKGSDRLYDRDGYADILDGGADSDPGSAFDADKDTVISLP